MSTSPKTAKTPDDPDPTPMVANDSTQEVQGASREARKNSARNYGRGKTILAGNANNSNTNEKKKTILGG